MHRPRLIWMLGVLGVLLVVTAAGWLLFKPPPEFVQGMVEATQVDVAAKIPARVGYLNVREGQHVRKGELLVSLDSPEIRAKLAQAAAAKSAAAAQQRKVEKGAREEEIRAAHDLWQRAERAAGLAEKTFRRVDKLFADGVVPAQKRDEAEANWKASRDAANAAKAQYDMAVAGARTEDREAAAALVEQAAGAVSEVEAFLEETRLVAPIEGEVVECIVDPGELVSPGYPIVTLVDLNDIWVTYNVREDRLAHVRMGDRLIARIPALGNQEIECQVTYISALGDFATWRATQASGDFDLKTFEVRARPVQPVPGLRPGMSAITVWPKSD